MEWNIKIQITHLQCVHTRNRRIWKVAQIACKPEMVKSNIYRLYCATPCEFIENIGKKI